MKLNVALLAGGDSSEREVSLGSAANVAAALDREKYDVFLVDINGRNWVYVNAKGEVCRVDRNDFSVTDGDRKYVFDYALIMIHGTPGEDGRMQGYLDMMGVPYSSCGMVSSVVTFDKLTTKRAVSGAGLNLAKEIVIMKGDPVAADRMAAELGLPMFVKPNASGSSCGVTKVRTVNEILPAIEAAFAESDMVLAEEFIAGREFGVGLMMASGKEYIFPITEIVTKSDFFDYKTKYTPGLADEITPAQIDESLAKQLRSMAADAYRACRCKGLVRIDFIVTADGAPYMIEVNSIPGMSSGSIIPKQLAVMGMSVGELYDIIISDGSCI